MPPVITALDQLAPHLCSLPVESVVGIEGFLGAGKSFLAKQLAERCGFPVLHTDDFIQGDDETKIYLERLDLARLKIVFIQLSAHKTPTLIEGICLREIANQASIPVSLYVYVKRISDSGLWQDGLDLEDFEANADTNASEPELSDVRYHAKERPHEKANFEIRHPEQ